MDQEKIFNLQITVQKLQEELSLYRNGTSIDEVFTLLKEKEGEVALLKEAIAEKDTKLRKLAKTSNDVLVKCESLEEESVSLYEQNQSLIDEMKEKEQKIQDLEDQINHSVEELNKMTYTNRKNQEYINLLIVELSQYKREKFDLCCNQIDFSFTQELKIKEKNENLKKMEELLNTKEKEKEKLLSELNKSDQSIERLQKRCAELVIEKTEKLRQLDNERQDMINHVQKFRESMANNLLQRDEALKRKDKKLKEVSSELENLKKENSNKSEQLNSVDELQQILRKTRDELKDTKKKSSYYEEKYKNSLQTSDEVQKMRARMNELEEKLQKQNQAIKSRVLKERTNRPTEEEAKKPSELNIKTLEPTQFSKVPTMAKNRPAYSAGLR